jgi:hypothetical protein
MCSTSKKKNFIIYKACVNNAGQADIFSALICKHHYPTLTDHLCIKQRVFIIECNFYNV